jgi:tRNA A-37 threonylcarbamoyl transferase component Bud32
VVAAVDGDIVRSMANGPRSSSGRSPLYHAAVLPLGSFVELRASGNRGWVAAELASLGLGAFWAPLQPLPGAKGRGGIGCLELAGRQLVVRPYRRGGALGRLFRDRYAGPGRARDELLLLAALRAAGVPVVTPVAAVAQRRGAFWRLRLCTELEPGAMPVAEFLRQWPTLRRICAAAVGNVVRLAFAAGLRHPDLHLDNVLCSARGDRVRVVLVDLDRAECRPPVTDAARDEMLVRMARHLVRHRRELASWPSGAERMRFLRAFWPEVAARHAAWRSLAVRLQRSLRRRDLWRGRVTSA